jgi:hypothetical protein
MLMPVDIKTIEHDPKNTGLQITVAYCSIDLVAVIGSAS